MYNKSEILKTLINEYDVKSARKSKDLSHLKVLIVLLVT